MRGSCARLAARCCLTLTRDELLLPVAAKNEAVGGLLTGAFFQVAMSERQPVPLLLELRTCCLPYLTPELSRTAQAAERCGTRYHKAEAAKRSRLERIVRQQPV